MGNISLGNEFSEKTALKQEIKPERL